MKIKMLTSIAGHAEPAYGLDEFSFVPGQVVDLDPALAKVWVESGLAESVPEESKAKRKESK